MPNKEEQSYEEVSRKRKLLQRNGEAPEWMHTAGLQMMQQKKYLIGQETPKERMEDIAKRLASFVDGKLPVFQEYCNWSQAFFDVMWKGHVSLSTPALSNVGRVGSNAHGIACSGVYLENSISGFYKARLENAVLTKAGYGTSWCLDEVSPRGEVQASGVVASGATMPMNGAVQDMADVSQSSRRGSIGQYINVLHPDFREIVEHLLAENFGLNIGWNIDEQFEELFNRDYEKAQAIWKTMLVTKMKTGKGYMLFLNKVNANRPQMYIDRGFTVSHSNLCVTGDTKILTEDGYKRIDTLDGKVVSAWNGEEWSDTVFAKTGDNSHILEVTLSNNTVIKATDYHKWYDVTGKELRTNELQVGTHLNNTHYPDGSKLTNLKVVSIKDNAEHTKVYCGNEPKRHKLVFNGVLTGQCSEILLFNDKNHSFTCVLSSMNVAKYDEWKDTNAVKIAVVMLDCIISDMLEMSKGNPDFDNVVRFTERTRAIGLGQLGLFSYLQKKSLVVGSVEAMALNHQITDKLEKDSFETSKWLAEYLGEPQYLKGYGHRFSHTLAFPPTKSTSLIQGGVSEGINPFFANVFLQDPASSTIMRVNPVLLDLMKEKGVYTEANLTEVLEDNGSVQGVDWLNDHEKAVFRTAFEINQETLLAMNSQRQKLMSRNGMGQSQSFNFFFQKEATEAYVSKLHDMAFRDPWCFSLYYAHSLTKPSTYLAEAICDGCSG